MQSARRWREESEVCVNITRVGCRLIAPVAPLPVAARGDNVNAVATGNGELEGLVTSTELVTTPIDKALTTWLTERTLGE